MRAGQILSGDARARLADVADGTVDVVLTSPPYFNLRDYGHADQFGAEPAVEQWVEQLASVCDELARVLVPTGSLWLNVGDSYAVHRRQGALRKSLLLGPERLALRLIEHGWLVRSKLVWQKANPMPTSVRDRFACTWEYVFVLTRSPRYYFDLDSVRRPHRSSPSKHHRRTALVHGAEQWRGISSAGTAGLTALKAAGLVGHPLGANPGDVLRLASSNFRGEHRATFPLTLARHALLAGCPEARCSRCFRPHVRDVLRAQDGSASRSHLRSTCDCGASPEPGIVLDPFMGAGTTAIAAEQLGRRWLGIELNPAYVELATQRITAARPPTTWAA